MIKKRIIIVLVWLASLIAVGLFHARIEDGRYSRKAGEELLQEAHMLAGLVPSYVQNHFYSSNFLLIMQNAKLNALSMALEKTEDAGAVREVVEEFMRVSGMTSLAVYDRDGRVIYDSGDHILEGIDFDDILDAADQFDISQTISQDEISPKAYMNYYLSSEAARNENPMIVRPVKGGQWILGVSNVLSEQELEFGSGFDWKTVVAGIRIGNSGTLLAVDSEDGTILSYGGREDLAGENVDALGIVVDGEDHAASLEELLEVFHQPNQLQKIRMDGEDFFAVRLKVNNVLMLALLPAPEIRNSARGAMSFLVLLPFLATSVLVLYSVLHVHSPEEGRMTEPGRAAWRWNTDLSVRLSVIAFLTAIAVFISGVFLESLIAYSDTYRYCQDKVSDAARIYTEYDEATWDLDLWLKEEYLTRCRIARMILERMDPDDVTPEYLERLSESLCVESVYVFDEEGNVRVTNAPYDGVIISDEDPFHVLLQGGTELAMRPELDEITNKTMQKAGISLRGEDNKCSGMILIAGDASEITAIQDNLDFDHTFKRISLTDGTTVMTVYKMSGTEAELAAAAGQITDLITYNAQVKNGTYRIGLDSFDYTGYTAQEAGINPEKLYDNYNGSMTLLGSPMFASVRRAKEYFFLVMRQQVTISAGILIQAAVITAFTLAILLLVIVTSCLHRTHPFVREEIRGAARDDSPDQSAQDDRKEVPAEDKSGTNTAGQGRELSPGGNARVFSTLSSFLNRRKPDFEERWPSDCKRWKDKTAGEKYLVCLKALLIVSLLIVCVNAVYAGRDSVWFYIFSGQWNDGVNLHSVSACLIEIWILCILKIVIHKMLFLTARALDTQGETICMLLNSFCGYALVIVGIFSCLANFGISAGALSLSAGVAGVIFSIGCQSIVADILAGILMTFEGVVHVGDFLSFNQKPGYVQSIGVRTTRLKFFGEITIVRNNEFKNYVQMPLEQESLISSSLTVDHHESLERIERILDMELPGIHDRLCDKVRDSISGPRYSSVSSITENGIELAFTTFCKGRHAITVRREVNRELKLMCERNRIAIAIPKVEVKEPDSEL